jgi:ABC-type multidrug transport system fused ATPase/permease subunit
VSRSGFEESGADTARTFALLGRALRFLAPYRLQVLGKLGLLIVSFLPLLVLPWPIKIIIDHVILKVPIGEQAHPYPPFIAALLRPLESASPVEILLWVVGVQLSLVVLVGAFGTGGGERDETEAWLSSGHDEATRTENAANAGFSFAGGLLGLLDFRFTMRLTQRINHHYRSRLFERIQTLPMPAFDDERIGDAVYRVMYDTPSITEACYRIALTPPGAAVAISMAVGIMAVTFGDHPRIYWTAMAFAPVALLATLPFAAMLRRRHGEARKAGATTTSTIEEGMTNILAVQSLGGHGREKRRFDRESWTSFGRFRGVVLAGMLAFLAALVPGVALAATSFLYVTDLVIEEQISVGDFTLLFTYFAQILIASVDLGALWIRLQGAAAGLNRVFFLMDLPGEAEAAGDRVLESVREGVRFEEISYAYPDGTEALHDVSLEAPVGHITALVGPAGAGKTTLAYLIPRFITPRHGRVCIDGVDVESLERTSLRSRVAFVFQETSLFDETVLDNIRLGRPDAPETEVRRAARMAGADDFIQALPQGYQTRLGRAGSKLSVGQKQRLSIARALVREAPILILDEPTSALDPETEQRLVAALRNARAGRVVLVIAHRLSTVRSADQILFVENGRIIERGSHEVLMAREGGAYRRYVELQTRGAA